MNPNRINLLFLAFTALTAASTFAQNSATSEQQGPGVDNTSLSESQPEQKVVVVTGARFAYRLVEKWIDEYNKVNPQIQIIVESRGSADPLKYDILAEVYEHEDEFRKNRKYVYVGRYAVLPVANNASSFARTYSEKGLNTDLIRQIFFNDIFSDKSRQKTIEAPYAVYRRLQRAGVPIVFSTYFGYEYKDLKGTVIAGADAHVLRATLRDSIGVTYLPLPLIYDEHTRKAVEGIVVLPVDLNGNRKVSDDEKFYDTSDRVIEILEAGESHTIRNVPIEYLHLSVDPSKASDEAVDFLKWVSEHGQNYLNEFGYLKTEGKHSRNEKFNEFASGRGR